MPELLIEHRIAEILGRVADPRAPYTKGIIHMLAKLVTDEREACAKIAEGYEELSGRVVVGHGIAHAIRARKD